MSKNKNEQLASPAAPVTAGAQAVLQISKRMLVMFLLIAFVIMGLDRLDLFQADLSNDHAKKKWDTFYGFTIGLNVDVLLLGNSHLYTGVNPETFCTAMGVNAFILATPGTSIADTYFSLKEALTRCKPGLVVIETYGINDFDPYHNSPLGLSEQMNSFSARNGFFTKLVSTPQLFAPQHYLEAWSQTIRNHHYIFSQPELLIKNGSALIHPEKKSTELNLGRFVRFISGLSPATLARYDKDGAPVDGAEYQYSKYAELYVDKIVKLCRQNHITLMFFTVPMYSKQVKNYSAWKAKLGEILDRYPNPWLDLQESRFEKDFAPDCFEDAYTKNQHMTYLGSLKATYKLCNFINEKVHPTLPDRHTEKKWVGLFYGKDGYFENHLPIPADPNARLIGRDKVFRTIAISEILSVRKNDKVMTLIAKVKRDQLVNRNPEKSKLKLLFTVSDKKGPRQISAVLPYDPFEETPRWVIFELNIIPANITGITDGEIQFE